MTTLFYIASLDKPYIYDFLLEKNITGDCYFLTREPKVAQELYRIGIQRVFLVDIGENLSQEERDSRFREQFMPGLFNDMTYTDTDLPVYKVMSLDRLFFWQTGGAVQWQHIVDNLVFSEIVVTLTLNDSFAWRLLTRYMQDTAVIGIQGEHMLTEEWHYLIPELEWVTFVIEEETKAIMTEGHSCYTVPDVPKKTLYEPQETQRDKIGVVYDKRYDQQFRMVLKSKLRDQFLIFTLDGRSSQLLAKCNPGAIESNKSRMNDCHTIYIPCPYDYDFGTETKIYDLYGVWQTLFPDKVVMLEDKPEGVIGSG